MLVVCISDTHLQHKFDVPDGDVLVHAGDALNYGRSVEELRTFLYWFKNLPHAHKIYVAGNHDWVLDPGYSVSKRLSALELLRDAAPNGVRYVQDEEVEVAGLRIYGSPWQPEFCGWAFNLPRRGYQLAARWSGIPQGLDILITHGPPYGVLDRNPNDDRCGCELLWDRVLVTRPKVHVFGHIHAGYGKQQLGDTVFVNASVCDERYRPWNAPQVIELP